LGVFISSSQISFRSSSCSHRSPGNTVPTLEWDRSPADTGSRTHAEVTRVDSLYGRTFPPHTVPADNHLPIPGASCRCSLHSPLARSGSTSLSLPREHTTRSCAATPASSFPRRSTPQMSAASSLDSPSLLLAQSLASALSALQESHHRPLHRISCPPRENIVHAVDCRSKQARWNILLADFGCLETGTPVGTAVRGQRFGLGPANQSFSENDLALLKLSLKHQGLVEYPLLLDWEDKDSTRLLQKESWPTRMHKGCTPRWIGWCWPFSDARQQQTPSSSTSSFITFVEYYSASLADVLMPKAKMILSRA